MNYQNIQVETRGPVALITLNRPKAFNALSDALMEELTQALDVIEADESVRAIVLTGGEKVFAAGADIKGMKDYLYMDAYKSNFITRNWERVSRCRKPVIAAVAGFALGGGCELALMCDFIYCAENAKFGLPEVTLGVIPGIGGTQRLTHAIGKAKAMEMCLTARQMGAVEAELSGLVARVFNKEDLLEQTLQAAEQIATRSLTANMMLKETINRAFEVNLTEGLRFERRMFHSIFATADQKEGMQAFVEKRQANFKNQ